MVMATIYSCQTRKQLPSNSAVPFYRRIDIDPCIMTSMGDSVLFLASSFVDLLASVVIGWKVVLLVDASTGGSFLPINTSMGCGG